MQERSSPQRSPCDFTPYSPRVPRQLTKARPKQGARLLALRKTSGFSQAELASLVDEPQQNIALWETSEKPPRSDAIPKLAKALGVHIEDLFIETVTPTKRPGPVGRLRKLFDNISKLPRRQQDKIIEFFEPIVEQHSKKAG